MNPFLIMRDGSEYASAPSLAAACRGLHYCERSGLYVIRFTFNGETIDLSTYNWSRNNLFSFPRQRDECLCKMDDPLSWLEYQRISKGRDRE